VRLTVDYRTLRLSTVRAVSCTRLATALATEPVPVVVPGRTPLLPIGRLDALHRRREIAQVAA
jgi:hypothetical protein